jgi:hypothetical protein
MWTMYFLDHFQANTWFQELYAFAIDTEVTSSDGTIDGRARAFALYHRATKHDWVSRRYAQERLHVFDYPRISKKGDSETRRAIGKLELRWTCKGLSPFQQRSKFYVAPHADFDVLFGYKTGSSQRARRKLDISGASGTSDRHKVANFRAGALDGLRAPDENPADNVSFEKGIRDGILLPVDDEITNDEEALLRPSLADLEPILHATPYETSIPSQQATLHVSKAMDPVVAHPPQVPGEVFDEIVPQQASGPAKMPLPGAGVSLKRKEWTSGFDSESNRKFSQCLSTAVTAHDKAPGLLLDGGLLNGANVVDQSCSDGRNEFHLLPKTESSWPRSAPHPIVDSREMPPLENSEYIPSQRPLAPNSDHRHPGRNLEESNEYSLVSSPQSLAQRPGWHTFSSDNEDLRLGAENIPSAAIL